LARNVTTPTREPTDKGSDDIELGANRWARLIVLLAALAIVAGFVLTVVRVEPFQTASFWLLLLIAGAAVVSAIGWAFTEIRRQESVAQSSENFQESPQGMRILKYLGMLVVVALIAVGATMVPSRFTPVAWALFIPIWLVGGWWLRRRRHSRSIRNQKHHP
jgi:Ca2+/Na+ antiporter